MKYLKFILMLVLSCTLLFSFSACGKQLTLEEQILGSWYGFNHENTAPITEETYTFYSDNTMYCNSGRGHWFKWIVLEENQIKLIDEDGDGIVLNVAFEKDEMTFRAINLPDNYVSGFDGKYVRAKE